MIKKRTIGEATIYLGDFLHVVGELDQVDAVITDPPYSSGGQFRGDRTASTKDKYMQSDSGNRDKLAEFSGDTRDQRSFAFWSSVWSSAALQITKTGGIACFFTDWRQLPVSTDYLQAGGWVWRGVVPWAKPAYRPQMGRFGAQCEYVVWGSNGPMPTERGVGCLPGFFDQASPPKREHITQKPLQLMVEIAAIVPAGSVILDPFMGSGTTGVAALETGRKFIGCEITEANFDVACARLEAAARQADMIGHAAPAAAEQIGMFSA